MKQITIFLVLILTITISCKNEKKDSKPKTETIKSTKIPFAGTWSRSFEMGKGVSANVTYNIYNDSIQYKMEGPMNMSYTLTKDSFITKDNRWIGKGNGSPYAIFFKNISKDSITVLKMKIENKEKGLKMPFPSDSARSKFSSWNTYTKK